MFISSKKQLFALILISLISISIAGSNGCEDSQCLDCLNETQCKTCYYGWILKDGICQDCPSGTYYESSKNACSPCHHLCQICSGSKEDQCIKCLPGYDIYRDSPLNLYYYFNSACLACSDRNCSSCPNLDGCLDCFPGYYVNDIYNCQKCKVENCHTCSNGENSCTACKYGWLYDSVENICKSVDVKCSDPAKYSSEGQCKPCDVGCSNCKNLEYCYECAPGYFKPIEDLENGEGSTCFKCDSYCVECKMRSNICTKCSSDMVLSENRCEYRCDQFQFKNDKNECQQCPRDCYSCINSTTCTECNYYHFQDLVEGDCQFRCPVGQYAKHEKILTEATLRLSKAFGGVYTNGELVNYMLMLSQADKLGFFGRTITCEECKENCLVCFGVANFCLRCQDGYFLNYQKNTCGSCEIGEFVFDNPATGLKYCSQCTRPCIECDAHNCFKCESPFELINKKCVYRDIYLEENQICPKEKVQLDNLCMDKCPIGMELKEEDRYCTCDPSCQTCNFDINKNESSCTRCKFAYYSMLQLPVILGAKCIEKCPPGFKAQFYNDSAKLCVRECFLWEQYDLSRNQCVSTCDPGTFPYKDVCFVYNCMGSRKYFDYQSFTDKLSQNEIEFLPIDLLYNSDRIKEQLNAWQYEVCKSCMDNCAKCAKANECQECDAKFTWNQADQKCVAYTECQIGEITISDGITSICKPCKQNCQACIQGSYLLNSQCFEHCPEGYIESLNTCQKTIKSSSYFSGQGSPLGFLSAFHQIALNWSFEPIDNSQNKVVSVSCNLQIQHQLTDVKIDFPINEQIFSANSNTTIFYQFNPEYFENGIGVSATCTGKIINQNQEYVVISQAKMKTIPLPIGRLYIQQENRGSNVFAIQLTGFNPKFDMTPEEYLIMVSNSKQQNIQIIFINLRVVDNNVYFQSSLYLPFNFKITAMINNDQFQVNLFNQTFDNELYQESKRIQLPFPKENNTLTFSLEVSNYWIKQILPYYDVFTIAPPEIDFIEQFSNFQQIISSFNIEGDIIAWLMDIKKNGFYLTQDAKLSCNCQHGTCNLMISECQCEDDWIGESCNFPKDDTTIIISTLLENMNKITQKNNNQISTEVNLLMNDIQSQWIKIDTKNQQIFSLNLQLIDQIQLGTKNFDMSNFNKFLFTFDRLSQFDQQQFLNQQNEQLNSILQNSLYSLQYIMDKTFSQYQMFNYKTMAILATNINTTQTNDYVHNVNMGQFGMQIPHSVLLTQIQNTKNTPLPLIMVTKNSIPSNQVSFATKIVQLNITGPGNSQIFSIPSEKTNITITFSKNPEFKDQIECLYFDENQSQWITQNNLIKINESGSSIQCQTTHLSSFSIGKLKEISSQPSPTPPDSNTPDSNTPDSNIPNSDTPSPDTPATKPENDKNIPDTPSPNDGGSNKSKENSDEDDVKLPQGEQKLFDKNKTQENSIIFPVINLLGTLVFYASIQGMWWLYGTKFQKKDEQISPQDPDEKDKINDEKNLGNPGNLGNVNVNVVNVVNVINVSEKANDNIIQMNKYYICNIMSDLKKINLRVSLIFMWICSYEMILAFTIIVINKNEFTYGLYIMSIFISFLISQIITLIPPAIMHLIDKVCKFKRVKISQIVFLTLFGITELLIVLGLYKNNQTDETVQLHSIGTIALMILDMGFFDFVTISISKYGYEKITQIKRFKLLE